MTGSKRRTFVKLVATGAIAPAVAGCTGGDQDTDDGAGGGGGGGASVPAAIDSYLSEANGYDGSITDRTGQDSVTIDVGGGVGLAFTPAAVRIDAGTTVTWEWTGQGGSHNVVDEAGAFESEYHDSAGATFEYTFDETGDYTYYCEPHKTVGMKGGIAVR